MGVMAPVPEDDPLMVAWRDYRATADYDKRLRLQGVGPFRDMWDAEFGRVTELCGANGTGKSTVLRAIDTLTKKGRSLAELQRRGEEALAELYWQTADGELWRIRRRRSADGSEQAQAHVQEDEDVWASRPFEATLAELFDSAATPERLLDQRLSDAKRIALVVEAVPTVEGYDRAAVMAAAGVADLKPRIPAGLHPIEDVAQVRAAVFAARTDVNTGLRTERAAASGAELALPPEPPPDPSREEVELRAKLDAAGQRVATIIASADGREREALGIAAGANDRALVQAASDFEHAKRGAEEAYQRAIKEAARARDATIAAAQERKATATAEASAAHEKALADAQRQRQVDEAELPALREERARLEEALRGLAQRRDAFIADRARRQDAAEHREKEARLKERADALTTAIRHLDQVAAGFVASAIPLLRVEADDEGRQQLLVSTDQGWQPWSVANEGARMAAAVAWSLAHQKAWGGTQRVVEALLVLDQGESLDDDRRATAVGGAGQSIVARRVHGPLRVVVKEGA